jgi:hypothetical protein
MWDLVARMETKPLLWDSRKIFLIVGKPVNFQGEVSEHWRGLNCRGKG